ncbi:MMPL family transporter [Corynebacterium freneyi]|uniref:RND superfamily putative drug exporter n=1 Tax=Corynebacterium freneyi TaxID=134034 RepID=A0ABS4U742_9CORY|nr:MMPL family transporter [Corynebacterium freneyi]MBP2332474.1 RND superfamily putative drug exporter [Corynebacterium freneyi]QXA53344.1 MMPL family transporter [Corynebacterium freneyi]WJZ05420.1 Membrane protein YdfJ [Corynebacterium freneyi]
MATFLYKVGRSAYLHRWRFIAVWLLLILGAGTAAATLTQPMSNTFTIEGLESVETQERIQERFPGEGNALDAPTGTVVIQARDGAALTDPDVSAEVDAFVADLRGLDVLADTDALVSPVLAAGGVAQQMNEQYAGQGVPQEQIDANIAAVSPLSADKATGTVTVTFDAEGAMGVTGDAKDAFAAVVDDHDDGALDISYAGNVFQTNELSFVSELVGIAVAAMVLIITFGSFVAAGLPLLTGVIGVGIGIAGVYAATSVTDSIASMTPTLAVMIGLAVGIDYALFILSRFRNELVLHVGGNDLEPKELADELRGIPFRQRAHLAGLAVGKAGTAVVFAGMTVIIALVALSIIGIDFLTAMAFSAAATVFIAVLVAVTLLPAILGAVGTKVFAARAPFVKAPDPEDEKPTMGLKWVRMIRARPVAFLLGGVIVLALAAIPATQLRLAMPSDGSAAPGTPNRIAYETIDEAFGPGRNAPMVALVEVGDSSAADVDPAQLPMIHAQAAAHIQGIDGVVNAQVVGISEDGTAAQVLITPEVGATDPRAAEVLENIRAGEASFEEETPATYSVTGVSPIYEDISERLSDVLVPYVAIIMVLAFLLLMVVFRSLWVPLLAALGFGLSVAATIGLTVALWQEGWLGIVSDPQPLISFLPIMLIGIVFGLAMDYQVFLVTRMREGWAHGKTAGNATANGFKHGARVVTAAALIMISVFAAFMLMDEPFIKVMGFALALAVLLDAFIVRMTIIPATMFLLDERAWKIPAWLDKVLPKADIEGESLDVAAPPATPVEKVDSADSGA